MSKLISEEIFLFSFSVEIELSISRLLELIVQFGLLMLNEVASCFPIFSP